MCALTDIESTWEKRLNITTVGRDDLTADRYHHPYEPTPYRVLLRLADSGYIGEGDAVLDYGCGKGRVDFFLSHHTGASTIGIEYDERMLDFALANKKSSPAGKKVELVLTSAEEYELPHNVNRCYFFNPFSAEILKSVISRILDSFYACPREILLFFYYPSDEYVGYLMTVDELEFYDDIPCDDLFDGDVKRERILVFSLPDYSSFGDE